MLTFGEQSVRGLDLLSATDFFRVAHQKIFAAMARVAEEGRAVDFVTVRQDLTDHQEIEDTGGPAYLAALNDGQMRSVNLGYYADIVKEKRQLRELVALATRIERLAREGGTTSQDLLALADRELSRLGGHGSQDEGLTDQAAAMTTFLDTLEYRIAHKHDLLGLTTGWPTVDELTCGLIPGELTILAADTGGGKSAAAINIAATTASLHRPVIVFSLEMSRQQLLYRLAALKGDVEIWKIRTGYVLPNEEERLKLAMIDTGRWPLIIDDHPTSTVRDIRAQCRRTGTTPLALVVVDYIQLVSTPGRVDNRALEVGEIARGLKLLARELNVPVLALSQLSRASQKEKRRPKLHDLRESGGLEMNADNVWFLYEGEKDGEPATELIVGKARQGPLGAAHLRFEKATCRFFDLAAEKRASREPVQEPL